MNPNINSADRLFACTGPASIPIAARLAVALSPQSELEVEVTFDIEDLPSDGAMYVNLENIDASALLHLSIRTKTKSVVLNTRINGTWGLETSAEIDFSILRLWRLWITVENSGAFSVSLGTIILCKLNSGMQPEQIFKLSSNISARCATRGNKPTPDLCGVLDRLAPEGCTLLLHLPNGSNHSEFNVVTTRKVAALTAPRIRTVRIAERNWLFYLVEDQSGNKIEIQHPTGTLSIYDQPACTVAELTYAEVMLRGGDEDREGVEFSQLYWNNADDDMHCPIRLAISSDENRDNRGIGFRYLITPLSEFIRVLPPQNQIQFFQFEALGFNVTPIQLCLRTLVLNALDYELQTLAQASDFSPSRISDIVMLDVLSAFTSDDMKKRLVIDAPFLSSVFESNETALVKEIFLAEEPKCEEIVEPTPETLAMWQALRAIGNLVDGSVIETDALKREVVRQYEALPKAERLWFILEISPLLLSYGLNEIINSSISEDFIDKMVLTSDSDWLKSTLLIALASRHRYETCAIVLEGLSERNDETINCGAIGSLFKALAKLDLDSRVRIRLLQGLFGVIERFSSNEYSQFRHKGFIDALLCSLLSIALDSAWFQLNFLEFIRKHYSTIPEFWLELSSFKFSPMADAFAKRLLEIASSVETESLSLTFVKARSESDSGNSANDRFAHSTIGDRRYYFETFFAMQNLTSDVVLNCDREMSEDQSLRVAAHPIAKTFTSASFGFGLRDAVLRMQNYARGDYAQLLESLGSALIANDVNGVRGFLPIITGRQSLGDHETEAVILDALAWSLTKGQLDDVALRVLVLEVNHRLKNVTNLNLIAPGLYSAACRILATDSVDFLTLEAILVLKARWKFHFATNHLLSTSFEVNGCSYFSDTLIVLVTCRKFLTTRAQECRDTWVKDVEALGARVLFFYGSDHIGGDAIFDSSRGLVQLPIGDSYEELPEKILGMFRWVRKNRSELYILKIDDDCYLDAVNFLANLNYRRSHYFGRPLIARPESFDRGWHQERSVHAWAKRAIDTSPIGTRYADGGGSYSLSRRALDVLCSESITPNGRRLRIASFFEDKLIGDLLALGNIQLQDTGYTSSLARRTHKDAIPVLQIDRTFHPSRVSGISVAHLDQAGLMEGIRKNRNALQLTPPRLWPMTSKPSLAWDANMLEMLNPTNIQAKISGVEVLCVCTIRNERTMLPHFFRHYRSLGVKLFLAIDNLSDDGSREFLAGQDDVVLFSTANQYKSSHYGVEWQRTVLDHFCPGRWVVVADADEFLVLPERNLDSLASHCQELESAGFDAALVFMVDMYPKGELKSANFSMDTPERLATAFDKCPVRPWVFNRGPFGNMGSYVSSLRHRLLPKSSPERFTSQKIALFRYNPLLSFSEGFHFAAGARISPEPLAFRHYKYSAEFGAKAVLESQRGQHFGRGLEYRAYLGLVEAGVGSFWKEGISREEDLNASNLLIRLLKDVPMNSHFNY